MNQIHTYSQQKKGNNLKFLLYIKIIMNSMILLEKLGNLPINPFHVSLIMSYFWIAFNVMNDPLFDVGVEIKLDRAKFRPVRDLS